MRVVEPRDHRASRERDAPRSLPAQPLDVGVAPDRSDVVPAYRTRLHPRLGRIAREDLAAGHNDVDRRRLRGRVVRQCERTYDRRAPCERGVRAVRAAQIRIVNFRRDASEDNTTTTTSPHRPRDVSIATREAAHRLMYIESTRAQCGLVFGAYSPVNPTFATPRRLDSFGRHPSPPLVEWFRVDAAVSFVHDTIHPKSRRRTRSEPPGARDFANGARQLRSSPAATA